MCNLKLGRATGKIPYLYSRHFGWHNKEGPYAPRNSVLQLNNNINCRGMMFLKVVGILTIKSQDKIVAIEP